jgi:hypothetical protein
VAGEWIKMRSDLHDDPAVFRIASILKIDKFSVVGRLHTFWSWIDRHSVDGHVDGAASSDVDEIVRLDGFADALLQVRWLQADDDGLSIPRFERHNGDSAKNRTLKNQRQARWRAGKSDEHVDGESSTSASTKTSTRTSTVASTREEKSKSSKQPPIPPKGGETQESKKRTAIALKTFLENCRSTGEKPIPETDTVFDYATKTCIPSDFLRLHWLEFKARYTEEGSKRYKDWRAVFRKSVRGCWFKLWWISADGACALTTVGEQAKRAHGKDAA